jgi:hypothetical protein
VFCCFNTSHKITGRVFDVWMRLLKKVEGSVLWLARDNDAAQRNLLAEAQARGVAHRLCREAHLFRTAPGLILSHVTGKKHPKSPRFSTLFKGLARDPKIPSCIY